MTEVTVKLKNEFLSTLTSVKDKDNRYSDIRR